MNSKLLLTILPALLSLFGNQLSAAEKPNIIIFYADDLGWGEITAQGFSKDIPTPNIDSLAQNGLRFTNGYVAATYCTGNGVRVQILTNLTTFPGKGVRVQILTGKWGQGGMALT